MTGAALTRLCGASDESLPLIIEEAFRAERTKPVEPVDLPVGLALAFGPLLAPSPECEVKEVDAGRVDVCAFGALAFRGLNVLVLAGGAGFAQALYSFEAMSSVRSACRFLMSLGLTPPRIPVSLHSNNPEFPVSSSSVPCLAASMTFNSVLLCV